MGGKTTDAVDVYTYNTQFYLFHKNSYQMCKDLRNQNLSIYKLMVLLLNFFTSGVQCVQRYKGEAEYFKVFFPMDHHRLMRTLTFHYPFKFYFCPKKCDLIVTFSSYLGKCILHKYLF